MKVISVQDIWEFVPHRPPMVWVDKVTAYRSTGGETSVRLKIDGQYMNERGTLRQSSYLEFMAQSYAFTKVCHREFSGDPINQSPKRAFLASFNEAVFAERSVIDSVKPGDELQIEVAGVRAMGPIILFKGKVKRGAELLCEGRIKIFSE